MPRIPSHPESLLDILKQQQNRGDAGIRLAFHHELLAPVSLKDAPYHYCAVANKPELAALLYKRGLGNKEAVTIASFSSGGANGTTLWTKSIEISPSESALLAGHSDTAAVLANIERGIPFEWTRDNHRHYPEAFKEQVRSIVATLSAVPWYVNLPGPTRLAVMDELVKDRARKEVWGWLPAGLWQEGGELNFLGPDLSPRAIYLLEKYWRQEKVKGKHRQQVPQYQFRVGTGYAEGRRLWRWPKRIFRVAVGAITALCARRIGVKRFVPTYFLAAAASNSPFSALVLLSVALQMPCQE